MDVLYQIFGMALTAAAAPWARLIARRRHREAREPRALPGVRPGLGWTTRAAAVVVVLEAIPVLLLLFFMARFFMRIGQDDFLFVLAIILFIPLAALIALLAVGVAGMAGLALVGLLEGSSVVRWTIVGVSTAGVVLGAAVSLLDPPTLGYLIAGSCALEVVLLVLPATADDFRSTSPWPRTEASA